MTKAPRSPFVRWLMANRNLILFVATLMVVLLLPMFEDTPVGDFALAATSVMIVVVSVAVNGRSRKLFRLGLLLSVPAVALRILVSVDSHPALLAWSWGFMAAVLTVTIVRLFADVFAPGEVTRDKLFGCATVYLLMGLLWCFLFAMVEELAPGSFSGLAASKTVRVADLAYFSLNVASNVALTTVMPVSRVAQVLVLLLEYATVLYMTFVISRLVGLYSGTTPSSVKDPE